MSIHTPEWVHSAVFYQIFPDRFARSGRVETDLPLEDWDSAPTPLGFKGGDLFSVSEKLDYLQDLGITALYLCPIFASAANHRYHTYDYYNVDPLLGGNAALKELLDAAHQRNMKVVLDGVFNHASRGFWQFHHVLENGAASPYRDWFHFDPDRLYGRRPFQPYPADSAAQALESGQGSYEAVGYSSWWNLPALPKFNTDCPAVRKFLLSVAEFWVEFGIDGWRLDVPNEIDDDAFWREFRRRVRAINSETYIVGEVWDEATRWLQGDMWDAVMNYQITAACLGYFGGKNLDLEETRRPSSFSHVRTLNASEFSEEVQRLTTLYPPEVTACQLNLLDSHDMPRFLTCSQGDHTALKMAWLFVTLLPGAPCIYYGDEVGLEGRHDPDCRRAFPWNTDTWNDELREWFKACISLRRGRPAPPRELQKIAIGSEFSAAFVSRGEDSLTVAFNTGTEQAELRLPSDAGVSTNVVLQSHAEVQVREEGDNVVVTLPPRSTVALA